jgi:hypothetical protein
MFATVSLKIYTFKRSGSFVLLFLFEFFLGGWGGLNLGGKTCLKFSCLSSECDISPDVTEQEFMTEFQDFLRNINTNESRSATNMLFPNIPTNAFEHVTAQMQF